jgi:hypothetical protein
VGVFRGGPREKTGLRRLKGKFRFAIFREGSTEKSKLSQYKIAHLQKMQNKSEVKGKN